MAKTHDSLNFPNLITLIPVERRQSSLSLLRWEPTCKWKHLHESGTLQTVSTWMHSCSWLAWLLRWLVYTLAMRPGVVTSAFPSQPPTVQNRCCPGIVLSLTWRNLTSCNWKNTTLSYQMVTYHRWWSHGTGGEWGDTRSDGICLPKELFTVRPAGGQQPTSSSVVWLLLSLVNCLKVKPQALTLGPFWFSPPTHLWTGSQQLVVLSCLLGLTHNNSLVNKICTIAVEK